jgi:beta-lactamase regulating signal transducer with metallopeptidase domain
MKMGIMVLLAVTFGVLVIGVLPNQISNFQSPTEMKNLTSRAPLESGGVFNDTGEKSLTASTGTSADVVTESENQIASFEVVKTDLPYYSLWGVNILIALVAFLVVRRRMQ